MNRRIPNGSWCLFRANPSGSRKGKIVLVQHYDPQDQDSGGHFTIKVYHSEKATTEEGWRHERITLSPCSHDPTFKDIVFEDDAALGLTVIGEWVALL